MAKKTGLDSAWEELFERHHILDRLATNDTFTITSSEINQVKEARLMAKFDRSAQLPAIFLKNHLSILPTARGLYTIGPFKTHQPVEYADVRPIPVECPPLETLDCSNLYSEAAALLFCYNSGIIQDIMESSDVRFTVNGRMSSGHFSYSITDSIVPHTSHMIAVRNAQVEIDAGYESPDSFCICEAKNMASDELLIRQLYYPYRLWRSKISKPVCPLFLAYSNDIFHAFIYQFEDEYNYNSIVLKSHRAYTFADTPITLGDLELLLTTVKPPIQQTTITFPQANSFSRIVDLLSVLFEHSLTRDEVALKYEFVNRQTDYYISACQYLGFVERFNTEDGEKAYRLTPECRHIMQLRYHEKYLALIRKVIEQPVFYETSIATLKSGEIPNISFIVQVMNHYSLRISGDTLGRRASTVRRWIRWILDQCT